MQNWLENSVPEFIRVFDWLSGSPDLNPLDYRLWQILEEKACAKPHRNLESLKSSIIKSNSFSEKNPLGTLRIPVCTDDLIKRLKLCVKAKGNHFEYILY